MTLTSLCFAALAMADVLYQVATPKSRHSSGRSNPKIILSIGTDMFISIFLARF